MLKQPSAPAERYVYSTRYRAKPAPAERYVNLQVGLYQNFLI